MTQFPPSQPPSGGWPPTPPEAGWHPDPAGRHQHRYWDGVQWTDHVADGGVESVDPFAPSPPGAPDPQQGYGSWGGAPGPPATGGPRPRSGPSPALLIALGLLVVAVIVGVAVVLTQGGDDDDDETTGSTTTAEDGSEGGVVDAMATALEQNFSGQITREEAECIAQGFIDTFGLERMAEVNEGGGDAFANLTPEEQAAATSAMLECVDVETLAEIGQNPGSTGG